MTCPLKFRQKSFWAIVGLTFLTVGLFAGRVNSDVFYAWLRQELFPVLPEDSVVVMDNTSFHKRADIFEAIEQAGGLVVFFPPYSPDFNPVEKKRFVDENVVR